MDSTDLPAFVAELEALQVKAKNSRSPIGSSFISTTPEGYDFAQYLIDHAPALLALVRQLQGERDEAIENTDRMVEIFQSCTSFLPMTITDVMDADDLKFYRDICGDSEEEDD